MFDGRHFEIHERVQLIFLTGIISNLMFTPNFNDIGETCFDILIITLTNKMADIWKTNRLTEHVLYFIFTLF